VTVRAGGADSSSPSSVARYANPTTDSRAVALDRLSGSRRLLSCVDTDGATGTVDVVDQFAYGLGKEAFEPAKGDVGSEKFCINACVELNGERGAGGVNTCSFGWLPNALPALAYTYG
jgi:hypothetical protein